MSDDPNDPEVVERRRKARRTLAQAGQEYADSFDTTTGALVTGYVFIVELTTADGRFCVWLTGSGGEPDEENTEGLDSWRVEGLVRKVLRDLDARNVVDE
jgi:hypothetical protein